MNLRYSENTLCFRNGDDFGRFNGMTESNKTAKALEAHLRQWQEIGQHMKTIIAPVLKQQDQFQEALRPIVESQKAFQKSLEQISTNHEIWKNAIQSIERTTIVLPDWTSLTKQAEVYRKSIEGLISPAFKELQKSFRDLPPRTQEALILLGMHGWYLDLDMPFPALWELKKALSDGNVKEAEDALVEHFEGRLDDIEKTIIEKFPKRIKLVGSAFNAHRRKEYELSIPVLLSQTDGICKDVVNEYLFLKQNKRPRTAIYVEQVAADSYRAALLSPLAQTLPIAASEAERDEGFNELNRHMVLHGESLDYGTRKNSLKAISLINYVANVLELDVDDPESK